MTPLPSRSHPSPSATPSDEANVTAASVWPYEEYFALRPPSIDLGEIGDTLLGREPNPPHKLQDKLQDKLQEWEKPFRLDRYRRGRW